MSQPEAESILHAIAAPGRGETAADIRLLLLAAHPDDETIGASAALGRVPVSRVVFLTDGAPRDPQFRSPHVSGSRDLYACVRAEEAASALAHVNVSPDRMLFLTGVDQEAIFRVSALVDELLAIIQEFKPTIILTHAYEGGHPDHDTAALVARVSTQIVTRQNATAPEVLEMTSYHAVQGRRTTGQFLSSPPLLAGDIEPAVHLAMSAIERTRKSRMLGCYVSQWHVLSDIPLEPEQLRVAPIYDFTRPPHEGLLWYETLQWPVTGARWRELAGQALAQCGELACH